MKIKKITTGLICLFMASVSMSQDYIFFSNNYSVKGEVLRITDSVYYSFDGAVNIADREIDLTDDYDDVYSSGGARSDLEYKPYSKAMKKYADVYFGVNFHDNIYAIERNLIDSIILKSITINGAILTFTNHKLNAPDTIVTLFERGSFDKIKTSYNSCRFGVSTNIIEINDWRLNLIRKKDNKIVKTFCTSERIVFKDKAMELEKKNRYNGRITFLDENHIYILHPAKDSINEDVYAVEDFVRIGFYAPFKSGLINTLSAIVSLGTNKRIPYFDDYYRNYNLKKGKYKIELRQLATTNR